MKISKFLNNSTIDHSTAKRKDSLKRNLSLKKNSSRLSKKQGLHILLENANALSINNFRVIKHLANNFSEGSTSDAKRIQINHKSLKDFLNKRYPDPITNKIMRYFEFF